MGKRVPKQYALPFERVQMLAERLDQPLHWREPRMIFVDSISDLFHNDVPGNFILNVWGRMKATPQHTYQILTKRADRMKRAGEALETLPNVWLGVSVEDQRAADERIPLLLQTPATVRFVSCEPLLEKVRLEERWFEWYDPYEVSGQFPCYRPGIRWVIVGGESGPNYRPMDLDWARSLRDQCLVAGVPFWFKQQSALRPGFAPELDGVVWHQSASIEADVAVARQIMM